VASTTNATDATTRLQRELRGDLDTIVLMAMRKDPTRRYRSVEQLSDDVQRYLDGRPVVAQRDRLGYRVSKFVQRNRAGVLAGVLVMLSLVGGLATSLWQARVARTERSRADRRFAEVRTLATSFLFELHDAIVDLPGSTPARELLVKRALASLDGLAREAPGDASLQREIGEAYAKIGNVQGNSANSNLGDTKGALASYRKSLALLEGAAVLLPRDERVQQSLWTAYRGMASIHLSVGELSVALREYERARDIVLQLLVTHVGDPELRRALGSLYREIGDLQGGEGVSNLGDARGADESYRTAVTLQESLLKDVPTDVNARMAMASILMNKGAFDLTRGEAAAGPELHRAVALMEQVVSEHADNAFARDQLLTAYNRLRQPYADAEQYQEAIALDRKTIALLDVLIRSDTLNTVYPRNRSVMLNSLGRDLRASGDASAAVPLHRASLRVALSQSQRDPLSAEHKQDVVISQIFLADALADASQARAALEEYEHARAGATELRTLEAANPRHVHDLATIHAGIGRVLSELRQFVAADAAFRIAIPFAEQSFARDSSSQFEKASLANVYLAAGRYSAQRSIAPSAASERRQWCTAANARFDASVVLWQSMRAAGRLTLRWSRSLDQAVRGHLECGPPVAH
jgi:non-specific serine/threonine protein kinase/serine/threonine-protein kinase